MLTDGPHGVRRQQALDDAGLGGSRPATCFPTGSALAATWDVALLEEVGTALGREARAQGVSVLLGPGANLKRTPLCGRNFEYFSEDPLLSGRDRRRLDPRRAERRAWPPRSSTSPRTTRSTAATASTR